MNTTAKQHNWSALLIIFSEQNKMRPTRIGVFEGEPGAMTDYWLEDGLPLAGVDVDIHEKDAPTVEIMLGDISKNDSSHMTHVIKGVRSAKINLSADGNDDGLEIKDAEGRTTVLRFEN